MHLYQDQVSSQPVRPHYGLALVLAFGLVFDLDLGLALVFALAFFLALGRHMAWY